MFPRCHLSSMSLIASWIPSFASHINYYSESESENFSTDSKTMMNASSLQRFSCALLLLSLDSACAFVAPNLVAPRTKASTHLYSMFAIRENNAQLSYLEGIEYARRQLDQANNHGHTPQEDTVSTAPYSATFTTAEGAAATTTTPAPAQEPPPHVMTNKIVNKCFQLEEQEDACLCLSEIRLNPDQTLEVGMTDGPPHIHAEGTWTMRDDGAFAMSLTRIYGAGRKGTDMGEFSFQVERHFVGEMYSIGDTAAITGEAVAYDKQLGEATVGYFSMIDITQSAQSTEERFAQRGGMSQSYAM